MRYLNVKQEAVEERNKSHNAAHHSSFPSRHTALGSWGQIKWDGRKIPYTWVSPRSLSYYICDLYDAWFSFFIPFIFVSLAKTHVFCSDFKTSVQIWHSFLRKTWTNGRMQQVIPKWPCPARRLHDTTNKRQKKKMCGRSGNCSYLSLFQSIFRDFSLSYLVKERLKRKTSLSWTNSNSETSWRDAAMKSDLR